MLLEVEGNFINYVDIKPKKPNLGVKAVRLILRRFWEYLVSIQPS